VLRRQKGAFGPENWLELLHENEIRRAGIDVEMGVRPFLHGCPR